MELPYRESQGVIILSNRKNLGAQKFAVWTRWLYHRIIPAPLISCILIGWVNIFTLRLIPWAGIFLIFLILFLLPLSKIYNIVEGCSDSKTKLEWYKMNYNFCVNSGKSLSNLKLFGLYSLCEWFARVYTSIKSTKMKFVPIVMYPNDADGMANSVGAVWSGSVLFVQTGLSENLALLQ